MASIPSLYIHARSLPLYGAQKHGSSPYLVYTKMVATHFWYVDHGEGSDFLLRLGEILRVHARRFHFL